MHRGEPSSQVVGSESLLVWVSTTAEGPFEGLKLALCCD